jgi:hypothetical protein
MTSHWQLLPERLEYRTVRRVSGWVVFDFVEGVVQAGGLADPYRGAQSARA